MRLAAVHTKVGSRKSTESNEEIASTPTRWQGCLSRALCNIETNSVDEGCLSHALCTIETNSLDQGCLSHAL